LTFVGLLLLAPGGCQRRGCSGRCEPEAARPRPATRPATRPAKLPARPGEGKHLRSPLDAKDTAGAKQRFVELIRRSLNRRLRNRRARGRWAFWSEGSTRYKLENGERAYLMSFRRYSARSQEGFLVIGTISGHNTVVHGYWSVPAGIDDIHVMDMGGAGRMIYTVAFDTTGDHRRIYHTLLRFDGSQLSPVWSYRLAYHVAEPETYKPVSVTFRDEDDDGTREVRLRIPGPDTPHLWKRRWAMFKWDPPRNEFLPLRGLAFTPVALQKPLWAAFGFLEAVQTRTRKAAQRFGANQRRCRNIDDLWHAMVRRGYRAVGPLRPKGNVDPYHSREAAVLTDLERKGDARRYLAELKLVREGDGLNGWRVCRIRFFRI
jgi:hypothetical protein